MGAAVSSGHSCREHGGRLKRVDRNDVTGAQCGVCQGKIEVAVMRVHRCRKPGCAFVLHDGCYRLPVTVKRHFTHPQHRLSLAAVVGEVRSCSLCAKEFGPHTLEYSCTDKECATTGGFRVHRRCCNLPQAMSDTALHPHRKLFLTSPGNDGGGARRCFKCQKRASARLPAAWSYRCPDSTCKDWEICLECVLGNEDDTARCCCTGLRCDVDPGLLGEWIGELLCGIVRSTTGCPGFIAPAATRR